MIDPINAFEEAWLKICCNAMVFEDMLLCAVRPPTVPPGFYILQTPHDSETLWWYIMISFRGWTQRDSYSSW